MRSAEQIKNDIIAKAGSDAEYRNRLIANPREAASEVVGMDIPDGIEVFVHEESAKAYHVTLPQTQRLSPEQLEGAAGAGVNQSRGYGFDLNW